MSHPFDIDSPHCPILLMIGVPAPAMAAAVQAQPRSRVVLVEPDPDIAAQIRTQHAGQPAVSVLAGAVTDTQTPDPIILVQYNQPGLRSSWTPTSHLKQLLPGLKPRLTQDVPGIAVAQVLAEAGVEGLEKDRAQDGTSQGNVELWLDTGGSEALLLQAMIAQGALEHMARIVLRCGQEPLFDRALGAADLTTLLRRQGFGLVAQQSDDPDWPELHFERDILVTELRQALADQHGAQEQARAQYAALEAQLAAVNKNLAQTMEALEAKSGALSATEDKLTRARSKIALNAQELAEMRAETETAADQVTAIERAQKARDLAEDAAASAQADLALALRMQTLAQSDLRDLQIRYDRTERTCQSQATLLKKLTPRLQQAAAQLQALTFAENLSHAADSVDTSLPPSQEPAAKPVAAAPPKASAAKSASPKSRAAKPRSVKAGTAKPRAAKPASPKSESPR